MATCKQCGQSIIWPQPYKAGQRPFGPDGVTLHDCPAFKKKSIDEEVSEAQAFIDEEARKREATASAALAAAGGKSAKDQSIKEMHDENTEISKAFLAEKKRYNDLYEREVIAYEKEIQMKMNEEEMRRQHNIQ